MVALRLHRVVVLVTAVMAIFLATSFDGGFNAVSFASAEDAGAGERFEFQAEVSRLMDIIINSLYKNKDIFLRELISNASDALDKLRLLSLSDPDALGEGDDRKLEIKISYDKEERSLSIRDRGVGMTKDDLINNLGTVARSGTTQFVEAMSAGASDVNLIGQFGVGFYSVYLAADRVQVTSKNNEDDQYIWESSADQSFTVTKDPNGNTLGRGTEIKLFLKEDATDMTDETKLKDLIKKYSEFITFPIFLETQKSEEVEVPLEEGEGEDADEATSDEDKAAAEAKAEDSEELSAEDDETAEEDKPKTRTETVVTRNWEHMNDQPAIWTRSKREVEDSEYKAFYKALSKDQNDPANWIHFRAEGEIEFKSILYIPKECPHDYYDTYYKKSTSLRLYVRKVLISDEFDDFLPKYLNFIRGIVDSDDLPLNVSRETLQQNKVLKVMGKKIVRKALEMLRKMAQKEEEKAEEEEAEEGEKEADGEEEDEEDTALTYTQFWEQFGKSIKLGVVEDMANRMKLSKLLRFRSTVDDGEGWHSLDKYVDRMKEGQNEIYFVAGQSLEECKNSPFLAKVQSRGLEVLLLDDPVDEYTVQNIPEYDGKRLQSITKENLKFGDDAEELDAKRAEIYESTFKPVTTWLESLLGKKRVSKIVVAKSSSVSNEPALIVTSQYGYSANMERIIRAQAFSDPKKAQFLMAQKVLELNPRHPIVIELNNRVEEAAAAKAKEEEEKGESEEDAEAAEDDGDAVGSKKDDASRYHKGALDIDKGTRDLAFLLYDLSLLNSGFPVFDQKLFAKRLLHMTARGLSLDTVKLVDEIEVPEDEEGEGEEEEEVEVEADGETSQ